MNKVRLFSIVLLLGTLAYVAWLSREHSLGRFLLAGTIMLAGFIWLFTLAR